MADPTAPHAGHDRGSFYDAIGGRDALRRLIGSFYGQVVQPGAELGEPGPAPHWGWNGLL